MKNNKNQICCSIKPYAFLSYTLPLKSLNGDSVLEVLNFRENLM